MTTFREFLAESKGLRAGSFEHFAHHVRGSVEHDGTDAGWRHQEVLARHYKMKDADAVDFDDETVVSEPKLRDIYAKTVTPIGGVATKNYKP